MERKHLELLEQIAAEADNMYYYHPQCKEMEELIWLRDHGYIDLRQDEAGFNYALLLDPGEGWEEGSPL